MMKKPIMFALILFMAVLPLQTTRAEACQSVASDKVSFVSRPGSNYLHGYGIYRLGSVHNAYVYARKASPTLLIRVFKKSPEDKATQVVPSLPTAPRVIPTPEPTPAPVPEPIPAPTPDPDPVPQPAESSSAAQNEMLG